MLKYIVRKLLLGYKASSEDYINKIKGTETLEEVNQMIGSEGEKGSGFSQAGSDRRNP